MRAVVMVDRGSREGKGHAILGEVSLGGRMDAGGSPKPKIKILQLI